MKIGKNRSNNKGVHKSILFFDFFFLSKLVFSKKGLSKFNKYVYYFCSFWERKMKLLKEMKDVLIVNVVNSLKLLQLIRCIFKIEFVTKFTSPFLWIY